MAVGDAAAAAGLPVVSPSGLVRNGYEDINRLADAVAPYVDDTGWITLTLTNGWTVSSGLTPQYRRIGRTVHLRGRVSGGSAGTSIATLPVAVRPTRATNLAVREGTTTSTGIISVSTGITPGSNLTAPNIDSSYALD